MPVSHHLGAAVQLRSSGRAANAFSCWDVSSVSPHTTSFIFISDKWWVVWDYFITNFLLSIYLSVSMYHYKVLIYYYITFFGISSVHKMHFDNFTPLSYFWFFQDPTDCMFQILLTSFLMTFLKNIF